MGDEARDGDDCETCGGDGVVETFSERRLAGLESCPDCAGSGRAA